MRLILTILLIGLFKADAQIVINASAPYRPLGAANLLLDDYAGSEGAWSLRKLDKDYAGAAIRIRKDTTGQPEQDINFVGNNLDTNAIKSFINARDAYVVTFYDQSGNGRNMSQSTQASQPRIALGGVLDRSGGEIAVFFTSNDFLQTSAGVSTWNFFHNGTESFIAVVGQAGVSSNPTGIHCFIATNVGLTSRGFGLIYDDRNTTTRNNAYLMVVAGQNATNYVVENLKANEWTPNVQRLIVSNLDADNATAANRDNGYINNGNVINNNTQTTAVSALNATAELALGQSQTVGAQFNLTGYIQEVIVYDINQSSNRSAIQTNINTYWSIY